MLQTSRPLLVDPGSFREPAGTVFYWEGRIFRALGLESAARLRQVLETDLLKDWVSSGRVVSTRTVDLHYFPQSVLDALPFQPSLVVEHARIPYISYPYEWPFSLLKLAALHHLDLQVEALDASLTFVDSSAYNVQFQGICPVFIDLLSLRPYRPGEYWQGYRQFCVQFLNPLLLTANLGVPYGPWYRGTLEGIPVEDLAELLPKSTVLSWTPLVHVLWHARCIRNARRQPPNGLIVRNLLSRKLSKTALRGMLDGLRSYISTLKPKGLGNTLWHDYESNNSYSHKEIEMKARFVRDYVEAHSPSMIYDIGCNSGYFSEQALQSGAEQVIGFDFDQGALEAAVSRAQSHNLNFLPLFLDLANPSPNQGWMQNERRGFCERSTPDGLLALAVLHHMVIGRNIPLTQAVSWLIETAPGGIVEFVPKGDPMIADMLSRRDDIFPEYNIDQFRRELACRTTITREQVVSVSGRTLFMFSGRKI